jgi:hypothetical protein
VQLIRGNTVIGRQRHRADALSDPRLIGSPMIKSAGSRFQTKFKGSSNATMQGQRQGEVSRASRGDLNRASRGTSLPVGLFN